MGSFRLGAMVPNIFTGGIFSQESSHTRTAKYPCIYGILWSPQTVVWHQAQNVWVSELGEKEKEQAVEGRDARRQAVSEFDFYLAGACF